MVEGTRFAQLSEAIRQLKTENTELEEAQTRKHKLLEELIQQVGNLANSYTSLAHTI